MKSQYILPITIVVAGVIIAGAVFLVGKGGTSAPTDGSKVVARQYDATIDHVLGNPNAEVKVVEYMDLECPHCKVFNTTMHQIMDYYGASGKVAWVERPFPLASIHSKAPKEAEAAECAADQGGDAMYYKYIDGVFAVTPSENGLDAAQLPVIAQKAGVANIDQFNQCLSSGKYTKKISDSYAEAIKEGGQGTPFILVMVGTDSVVLNGDQPYSSMRAAIDTVLSGLGDSVTASTTTQ